MVLTLAFLLFVSSPFISNRWPDFDKYEMTMLASRAGPTKSGALCDTLKVGPIALENFDYSITIAYISKYFT
jgi:hypothetical protein